MNKSAFGITRAGQVATFYTDRKALKKKKRSKRLKKGGGAEVAFLWTTKYSAETEVF